MKEIIGISAALISTLSWAIGTTKLKEIGEKASPITMTLVKSIYCAILLAIIALLTRANLFIKPEYLWTLIARSITDNTIGESLFSDAKKKQSPSVIP